jgi:hypothetical protein
MALKLEASQVSPAGTITSDRRLFLRADEKTVVEEGHQDARFLLASEGGEIPADKVKQLGLSVTDGKVTQSLETMAEETANSNSALKRMAGGDQEMAKQELAKIEERTLREAKAKQAGIPAGSPGAAAVVGTPARGPVGASTESSTAAGGKATVVDGRATQADNAGHSAVVGAQARGAVGASPKSSTVKGGKATVVDTTAKQVAKPADKSRMATGDKAGKGRGK